jgi:hypothetical protein
MSRTACDRVLAIGIIDTLTAIQANAKATLNTRDVPVSRARATNISTVAMGPRNACMSLTTAPGFSVESIKNGLNPVSVMSMAYMSHIHANRPDHDHVECSKASEAVSQTAGAKEDIPTINASGVHQS